MEILKELCQAFNYTVNDLSRMIGVDEKEVNAWINNKSEPELKYYRDMALIFGTSVFHLKNNTGRIVTTSAHYWITQGVMDGFWGHAGIILNQSNYTKWYPISAYEKVKIEDALVSDSLSLSLETLNNRLLLIRKKSIKLLRTLDDASDGTDDWEIDWDDYQGLGCGEIYNLLHEHFDLNDYDPDSFLDNTSEKAREVISAIINEYNLNSDNYKELIYESIIHHTDGKKTKIIINENCILDLVEQFEDEQTFIRIENYLGDKLYFNFEKLEMIEIPLFLYHNNQLNDQEK
ncbi:helix-turn-helix domain-containing protein [Pantoea dispersa]|jgi:transcriptional regulator with XRE-family HTH domain|uniref:helix-turn-helix domain-containing protein n=1 Tax=Pantoea dispersa TaxID=59814 RepID=UPI001EB7FABC|nr:helix-turn-helix transcriptional regulator [Pantoea dispersa]MBZ6391598.1 helix-turn-helix transcriptional regulator [Pantoea dispersa]UXO69299.1 helix-turn-helix transcriptional regulator [Pantoea dispersa]